MANIKKDKPVPAWEITRMRLRPYLSLSFPQIGPKIIAVKALEAIRIPTKKSEAPKSFTILGKQRKYHSIAEYINENAKNNC